MARAAAPMFSPSCGSTSTTIGPASAIQFLVLSVPAPGMALSPRPAKALRKIYRHDSEVVCGFSRPANGCYSDAADAAGLGNWTRAIPAVFTPSAP
jgi:hypothetical protein